MELLSSATIVLVLLVVVVYKFFKTKYSYWEDKAFPYIKPVIPHGNLSGTMDKIHLSNQMQNYYNQMKGKGPFGGLYLMYRPAILVLDLDFAKLVLMKDFNSFQDRGLYYNQLDEPLSAHLITLDGHKWKSLRESISPAFTSAKMKVLFFSILSIAERLRQTLSNSIDDCTSLEITDLMARYTTDVIGTCAFGIECNSLIDPQAKFRIMGRKIFKEPRHSFKLRFLMGAFPELFRFLRMKTHLDEVAQFFTSICETNIKYREENNIQRNDFMNLLIQLKNDKNGPQISVDEVTAQSFVFFAAGFETSATTMSMLLYELALNPSIQNRVRDEIYAVLEKHDGRLSYEAVMDMHYLHCAINGKFQ